VHQGLGLAGGENVLVDEHVTSDHPFPSLPDLHQLGGQSGHEVLQPPGHVHVEFPDALDRPVEGGPVPVVVLADGEQALEVVARAVQAQGGEQTRRPAVAVQEGMDVNELELGDAAHENRMSLPFAVQPIHQFRHKDRHLVSWRRRVDCLAGCGVDDIVLDLAVFPGRRRAPPHSFDQPLVNLADQSLRDRCAAGEVLRDEIERPPVVQKLPHIVGVGFRYRLAGHQAFGLVEGQLRALNVRRVVGLEHQRLLAHLPDPFFREGGGFQETTRPLDPRQALGDAVRDRESGLESLCHILSPPCNVTAAMPNRAATSS